MIETKRKSQMIHVSNQQSGQGNGEPGKLHPCNFVTQKLYFNHTNWYLLCIKF